MVIGKKKKIMGKAWGTSPSPLSKNQALSKPQLGFYEASSKTYTDMCLELIFKCRIDQLQKRKLLERTEKQKSRWQSDHLISKKKWGVKKKTLKHQCNNVLAQPNNVAPESEEPSGWETIAY